MPNFADRPGLLFVLATLLPLVSFLLILLASAGWCIARRYRLDALYNLFGGDKPGKTPAILATAAIGLAFVCSAAGAVMYHVEHNHHLHAVHELEEDVHKLEAEHRQAEGNEKKRLHDEIHGKEDAIAALEKDWAKKRKGAAATKDE